MAIYHLSTKPISRSSGRSSVGAAAYRAGERLTNERDGITHDYRRKQGVEYSEIVLPEGSKADWARDRAALWNAAEFAESRKDARVAREYEIALPHELTADQRVELTRDFSRNLADKFDVAVDFAIHSPHGETDVRNHHAHIMVTTRVLGERGLGDKADIERENKWLLNNNMATSHMQIRDVRLSWEQIANQHLARAGHDLRIDHRSHQDRGLEIEPTQHVGVHATQMDRRGQAVDRTRQDADAAKRNADLIQQHPEQALTLITGEKSVFDRHDIARTLHRYIDDSETFQNAFAEVMNSPALVELQGEQKDAAGKAELARYSTREMVDLETGMAQSALRMGGVETHSVADRYVERAIAKQDQAIRTSVAHDLSGQVKSGELDSTEADQKIASAGLSDEQLNAVRRVTGPEQMSVVVGHAGAGKSTMLTAAREAWEAQGYRVHGAALAGKAAEGLEESSGVESRTLASWEHGWHAGKGQLDGKDVLVIDEAGMVGSKQMSRFVDVAEKGGSKIVLVGDHEQLQAIGAGAPFRTIAERVGTAELHDIRRQRVDWQQEASVDFASQRTGEGLAAYHERGAIHLGGSREDTRSEIVRDYLTDWDARPDGSRLAMAHRRVDVKALNTDIRAERQERGDLAKGAEAGEIAYQTNEGERSFAVGDRIVFLENNKDLDVKNGMLGTVESVKDGRISAGLDGKNRSVSVSTNDYKAFDHGYAITIHKTQGATADRSFVMASNTMDRHLTYVSMTRHKDDAQLYASQEEFRGRHSGKLVEHGTAPFENDPNNRDSYFVTLEAENGRQHTTWGVDLERAMKEAAPEQGDRIGLEHKGSQTVRLPDGQTAERNAWTVQNSEEMAFERLQSQLGRSGAKESTLDYGVERQEGRAVKETQTSESGLGPERSLERSPETGAQQEFGENQLLSSNERDSTSDRRLAAEMRPEQPTQEETPKRGLFSGLRFNRSKAPEMSKGLGGLEGGEQRPRPLHLSSGFDKSVDRYAKAYSAADKMERQDLPVLDGQKEELGCADQQLEKAQPGASQLMQSTLQHDPYARYSIREMTGHQRVQELTKSMDREKGLQADPAVRAVRFVEKWQKLDQERQQLGGGDDRNSLKQIQGDMREVSNEIKRDPEVEKILRGKTEELGISPPGQDQSIGQAMDKSISKGRDLGITR